MNFHKDVLIHAAADAVFEALTQPQQVAAWAEKVVRIELLDGAGTLRKGTRFHQVMRYGGTEVAFPGRVDVFARPRQLRVVISPKNYQIETDYRLEPTEEGTLVAVTTRLIESRWLTKWLVILFVKSQRRQFEKNMNRLQAHLEKAFGQIAPPARRAGAGPEFLPDEPHLDRVSEI